jgi:peptidoglycan/xylan/chitin deacetylase (PgdA/CDA1 family)
VAPRTPVVLLYHGVPRDERDPVCGRAFERQLAFLRERCEFVAPAQLGERRSSSERLRLVLTFDDGFRNNAEVAAPILRRYGIPALFFVSSRHAAPGKYLWFSYLRALERFFPGEELTFRGARLDMRPSARAGSVQWLQRTLLGLTPHPSAMYDAIENELPPLDAFVDAESLADLYAGMTAGQVASLAADPLFSIGIHTEDHPFLTKCTPEEALSQVQRNRRWLEDVCGRPCDAIAYPSGDYDDAVLDMCRRVRIADGYAVIPRSARPSRMEIPRIGVYAESIAALDFKAHWGSALRRAGLRVG